MSDNTKILVRNAREQDIPAVVEIDTEAFSAYGTAERPETFQLRLTAFPDGFVILVAENEIAAYGFGRHGLPSRYAYTGDSLRRCATESASAPTNASTCSRVFERPKDTRMLDRACAGVSPIASNTCDGSGAPLEHAAPLETAKPLKSRAISSASLSMPSKRKFAVLDTRAASPPLTHASGIRSSTAASR